jgi:hypothetical protein
VIHNITAGHFDAEGAVIKPLDMRTVNRLLDQFGERNTDGAPTLGGWRVRVEGGCVVLPWKGGRTNRMAEEFALRLQRETGCILADREHGRLINPDDLAGEKKAAG